MGDQTARNRRGTLVGQIVDGHELLHVLASGGMGEVYQARHLRLGMLRAIKVIRDNQREDPAAAERFQREAQVLSSLQHNAIVSIIEFGELPNGWPFLAMEYIDGPNLDQLIDGLGPMPLADALLVLEQIANALDYAHRQGVVHRDLKPANVLLRAGDVRQVKVIDFGLARSAAHDQRALTAQGQMVGSPLYMAPEQADGRLDLTAAVDSYALAGVAYTLISGRPLFPGLPLLPLIAAHASETPQRLGERVPGVPRLLDSLLAACLAKDPASRPHADELAGHLGRLARAAVEENPGGELAMASTIDAFTAARMATMHRKTAAGSSSVRDSELARLITSPPIDDGSGVSSALVNQALAVVSDLAQTLSRRDPELARLIDEAEVATSRLTDLEMDVALLDARLDEASASQRPALIRERAALDGQAAELRSRAADTQRALVAKIDSMRGVADETAASLFAEIDSVVTRLRQVAGSAH